MAGTTPGTSMSASRYLTQGTSLTHDITFLILTLFVTIFCQRTKTFLWYMAGIEPVTFVSSVWHINHSATMLLIEWNSTKTD